MPAILLLPRNAIDTTQHRKLGRAGPSSQGNSHLLYRHLTGTGRGRLGGEGPLHIGRSLVKVSLAGREGLRTLRATLRPGSETKDRHAFVRHGAAGLHLLALQ